MIPFIDLKLQYQAIREEILEATDQVLKSGRLMNGINTQNLEVQISKRSDSGQCVLVGSGTQALELIAAYHKQRGKFPSASNPRIVVPALTYPATINAFMTQGYEVIIGDVDYNGILDLNLLPEHFDAVCLVGLYGLPVFDKINWFRKHKQVHNKVIVEDAAQHWLADDFPIAPAMRAISFDPTKNLPNYGSGGAVTCWNKDAYEFLKAYRDNGKPHVDTMGTNSRMSEVDCAQMLIKLKYIDQWQDRRRDIARYYIEQFAKKQDKIRCFITPDNISIHGLQKFVIDVDQRDELYSNLWNNQIECKIHYDKPLHELGAYNHLQAPPVMASVASVLSQRVLSLPFYPELSDSEVEYIASRVLANV